MEAVRVEERRRQHRFPVHCRAYAVADGLSGLITDLSHGGAGVRCIARKRRPPTRTVVDICVDECEFRIRNVPCTVVDQRPLPADGFDPEKRLVRLAMRFQRLDAQQEEQLEYLLRRFTPERS